MAEVKNMYPVSGGDWKYEVTGGIIDSTDKDFKVKFKTAGKYMDRNIDVSIKPQIGTVNTGSHSVSLATGNFTVASTPNTDGKYEVSVSKTSTVSATLATAGWVDAVNAGSVTVSGKTTLDASTLSATQVTSDSVDQTVTIGAGYYPTERTVTVKAMTSVTPTTNLVTTNTNKYFTAGTSTDNSITLTPNYTTAAGFVGSATALNNGGTTYLKIKDGSFGTGASKTGYTEITENVVVPSEGYLLIEEGWYGKSAISLATLVPDFSASTDKAAVAHILQGYNAYDQDGKVLVGTIATLAPSTTYYTDEANTGFGLMGPGYLDKQYSIKAGSVAMTGAASSTISTATYTYNATNGNFDVAGSKAITGSVTSTVTPGWVAAGETQNSKISGTATLATTVAKIAGSTSFSGAATVTPEIARTSTAASGATNVGSADATTTAPTSGYFVSVASAAKTSVLTATPSVTTAGYGTAANHGIAGNTKAVGAEASATTYIPIAAGALEANTASVEASLSTTDGANKGVNISSVMSDAVAAEPTSGHYIAVNLTASGSSKVKTAGWLPAGTVGTAATASGTKYFTIADAATSVSGGGLTPTKGTAALTATGVSLLTTAPASGDYYTFTASASGHKVSRAAIKEAYTKAGYIPTATEVEGHTIAADSADVSTDSTSYYVVKSTLSATTVTPNTSSQVVTIGAGYYPEARSITVKSLSDAAGITPSTDYYTTTNTGYGSIGAGYVSATNYIKKGAVNTPATTISLSSSSGITAVENTTASTYTLTLSKEQSVTPNVGTNGWITSKEATAGKVTVSGSYTVSAAAFSAALSSATTKVGTVDISNNYEFTATTAGYTTATTKASVAVYQGDYE